MDLGTKAPEFSLPDTLTNTDRTFESIKGALGTLVYFTCNHCPYVIHVNQEILRIAADYMSRGIGMVAISSNDVEKYPDDAPDKMRIVGKVLQMPFPYLYDKSQAVARAYDAACTPDFYLFDADDRLVYRGRLDGSRPGNNIPLTGADLRQAMDTLLAGEAISPKQYPSAGCNIKWKPTH